MAISALEREAVWMDVDTSISVEDKTNRAVAPFLADGVWLALNAEWLLSTHTHTPRTVKRFHHFSKKKQKNKRTETNPFFIIIIL